ncbi:hypothetical protein NDU88_008541 [Pleurodeles waltl]|uniref:Uncharacterized protein n=1 Tax=Pleurodeles waltl TaxID=8319 RepID=A0AAV7NY94_PLEWA|nr:hypothetical protein NDU88_008541 [Pleurodeles waltl]
MFREADIIGASDDTVGGWCRGGTIKDDPEHHIIDNDTGDISPATLWDMAKVVFRDKLISHMAMIEWATKQRRQELEGNLDVAETSRKQQGTTRTPIKDDPEHHIIDNDTGDISPATLWDMAKVVFRDKLISHMVMIEWATKQRRQELEGNLDVAETCHKQQGTTRTP